MSVIVDRWYRLRCWIAALRAALAMCLPGSEGVEEVLVDDGVKRHDELIRSVSSSYGQHLDERASAEARVIRPASSTEIASRPNGRTVAWPARACDQWRLGAGATRLVLIDARAVRPSRRSACLGSRDEPNDGEERESVGNPVLTWAFRGPRSSGLPFAGCQQVADEGGHVLVGALCAVDVDLVHQVLGVPTSLGDLLGIEAGLIECGLGPMP